MTLIIYVTFSLVADRLCQSQGPLNNEGLASKHSRLSHFNSYALGLDVSHKQLVLSLRLRPRPRSLPDAYGVSGSLNSAGNTVSLNVERDLRQTQV